MEKRDSPGEQPVVQIIRQKMHPALRTALKLAEMERRWDDILGPQLAARTWPRSVEHGVLLVACETPAAAQMVNMSGGTLAARVRTVTGLELAGVRAVMRSPERRHTRAEPRARRLIPEKQDVDAAYARTSSVVRDPEVALAIARAEAAAKARWGGGRKNRSKTT